MLEGGPGTVTPRPDRFMDLHLQGAGSYTLRFDVTLKKALQTAGAKFGL